MYLVIQILIWENVVNNYNTGSQWSFFTRFFCWDRSRK